MEEPNSPPFPYPCPLYSSHTQLEPSSCCWVLSTTRVGGRVACAGPVSQAQREPAPASPCAACPPSLFVPEKGGGGRPTEPEAGHQP